ncbi:hypothetical protein PENFLA_c018G03561 [Penicillium flavigenum]|uniref:Major facilitator superfamily (MFS) profile domain-containing protein n=1 Tax=Penicillium flavigenum TaxID=254877 RepID=A0A1V6T0K8_9EURO|nr:hypothetical protein PENFLA_c018G03561 [Penicillium flavigenum]
MSETNSNLAAGTKEERTDTSSQSQDELAAVKYPSGPVLVIIVIALMFEMFLSIISTAIPKITTQFKSMEDIGWYGSSFFLTLAAFQSAWDHVYKRFSLRGSFLAAIGIFGIGSLVCALAPNSIALIVGRAIQGILLGGRLTGGCYTIAAFIAPSKKSPYSLVYWGLHSV